MKGSTRWILFGAAGLIALMVIGLVLQGIRNLLWDLSYWLPPITSYMNHFSLLKPIFIQPEIVLMLTSCF